MMKIIKVDEWPLSVTDDQGTRYPVEFRGNIALGAPGSWPQYYKKDGLTYHMLEPEMIEPIGDLLNEIDMLKVGIIEMEEASIEREGKRSPYADLAKDAIRATEIKAPLTLTAEAYALGDSPTGTEMDPKDLVVLGELFSVQEIIQLRIAGLV